MVYFYMNNKFLKFVVLLKKNLYNLNQLKIDILLFTINKKN